MTTTQTYGNSTLSIHTGYDASREHGAIIPPLHLTTTFQFGNDGGYEYSRSGNPTRQILETTLAALDSANYALTYSSGSAVLANVASLLGSGEEILFSSDAYGGTYRYITQVLGKQGIGHQVADFSDPGAVEQTLATSNVKIMWFETPTNPLLKVADIAALAKLAKPHGVITVVDNTFATPVAQQPLQFGADIVVYSTTKYINGHSDSVGGSLALNDAKLYERLKFLQNAIGAIMSPFDAWLTLRGLRTLELRMQRHTENAQAIAEFLHTHPRVANVYYPSLFTGAQGDIARRQLKLTGGIVSVELSPEYDAQSFIDALRLFPLAESLGGVESLIDHPATMTHAAIPREEREKIGLSDGLFRISVGIENRDDLVEDLRQALSSMRLTQNNTPLTRERVGDLL